MLQVVFHDTRDEYHHGYERQDPSKHLLKAFIVREEDSTLNLNTELGIPGMYTYDVIKELQDRVAKLESECLCGVLANLLNPISILTLAFGFMACYMLLRVPIRN